MTALGMTRMGSFQKQGTLVICSVAVFGLATIAFGLSRVFWFSLIMLAITGLRIRSAPVLRHGGRGCQKPWLRTKDTGARAGKVLS